MRSTLFSSSSPLSSVFAIALLAGCAIDPATNEAVAEASSELVGGQVAAASEFPSTLQIEGGCTGAKVGPRHVLLAAHCVHNPLFNAAERNYAPGKSIRISAGKVIAHQDPSYRAFEIEKTHIPPWWTSACKRPCVNNMLGSTHPADVAVVVVKTDLEGIPTAAVDLRPVRVGEPVVVTGAGCESGLRGPVDYLLRRQKYQRTFAIGEDRLLENPRFQSGDAKVDVAVLLQDFLLTPGQSLDRAQASLCPGDSGGPVYRDDGRGQTVVGINSYYSFPPESVDPNGISDTNWHARVDAESRDGVGAWLSELGVSEVTSRPPRNPYEPVKADSSDAQSGVVTGRGCEGSAGALVESGGHLAFKDVDFGPLAPRDVVARFAPSGPFSSWWAWGRIEFHLDGLTGPTVAEVAVSGARGLPQIRTRPATAANVSGVHDLYVTFKSTRPRDAVDLQWFRFNRRAPPRDTLPTASP